MISFFFVLFTRQIVAQHLFTYGLFLGGLLGRRKEKELNLEALALLQVPQQDHPAAHHLQHLRWLPLLQQPGHSLAVGLGKLVERVRGGGSGLTYRQPGL